MSKQYLFEVSTWRHAELKVEAENEEQAHEKLQKGEYEIIEEEDSNQGLIDGSEFLFDVQE